MSFETSITNGELHAIMRRLGISSPDEDPIGIGIGIVQAAARRLGHPISWEDAESLSQAESERVLAAAEAIPAGDAAARSEAISALMSALPPTEAAPDPE